ncbi:hypothetical protein D3C87_1139520 [compost metagenome]
MARGSVRAGSAASPAATPTVSVPWNENPAIIATANIPGTPPTNGASPVVKLCQPDCGPPFMMPKIISTPTPRKTTTVTTLISANQYSASPKPRTENALSANISVRKPALQAMPGTSGNQYCMTSWAAVSSTAIVTARLNQ